MFHETTKLYDIPLNHLDFAYITGCNKLKELEKILKVLRSGSEGRYPELERHCEEKLRSLDPENRLLRNPGLLLSPHQLPPEEREEIEYGLHEWLEETKKQERLFTNAGKISKTDEDKDDPLVPRVRQLGAINPDTGKGTRVQPSKMKPTRLRTYEEWDKLGKELEKELEVEECKEQATNVNSNDSEVRRTIPEKLNPNLDSLHERARSMPNYIRKINAQREKEKGNEALIAGDYTEALKYYERSLIYKPTTAVYNNRALLYLKMKKWRLAVDDTTRVLGEEPKNIKALMRRAQAFYELHSLKKAQRDLEFILEMEPENLRATKLLKVVKEDHASRQSCHLKGGRRMVIEEVDEDSTDEDQDEGYGDGEDETNAKTEPVNSGVIQMPPTIKRGVEIEEIFDEGSRDEDSIPLNKGYTKKDEAKMPPIRRDVEIEEIFDEVSKEENSISHSNEKTIKREDASVQTQRPTVYFSNSDDNKRRYSDLIEELREMEASRLQAALDAKLDVKLLEEYIFALQEVGLPEGDCEFIHKSLEIICQSARFTVAAMLLSDSAIKATENIFDQLRTTSTDPSGLNELQSRFLNC
nr:sperm associated antigen 1 [Hymenolepis microstoma]